jgi:hypothetical protein
VTPEQEQLQQEYHEARGRAENAWKRVDAAWQSGRQGTAEGMAALAEANEASTAATLAYEKYASSFAGP